VLFKRPQLVDYGGLLIFARSESIFCSSGNRLPLSQLG
jgi:hypothetical protein